MLDYEFEHDGDRGRLTLISQFGDTHEINCEKTSTQTFRAGGTGATGIRVVSCRVLAIHAESVTVLVTGDIKIRVEDFRRQGLQVGSQAFIMEHFPLDMEGKGPRPYVSASKPSNPDIQFINVDCLDGGGNLMKRYRIDAFTGEHRVI